MLKELLQIFGMNKYQVKAGQSMPAINMKSIMEEKHMTPRQIRMRRREEIATRSRRINREKNKW